MVLVKKLIKKNSLVVFADMYNSASENKNLIYNYIFY